MKLLLRCAGVILFVLFAHPASAFWGGPSVTEVTAQGDEIRIPAKEVSSTPGYYAITVTRPDGSSAKVRFFLIRDTAGEPRLAVDACDSCWPAGKGYVQDGESMRCENCGMLFHVNRIGKRKGGCNPHPVSFTQTDNAVIIPLGELRDGAKYFK